MLMYFLIIIEPRLQNVNFRANKKRIISKRWTLYIKNLGSYGNFCPQMYDKFLIISKFSVNFFRYLPVFLLMIINLICFKKPLSIIRFHCAPSLNSRGWPKWPLPGFNWEFETLPLKGLKIVALRNFGRNSKKLKFAIQY